MIGHALFNALTLDGHKVMRLVRNSTVHDSDIIPWNPAQGKLDGSLLEGVDAVIHLAGENLVAGRWTKKQRQRIYDSRVNSGRLLCDRLSTLSKPPSIYISASAVGYYGNRGEDKLTEHSSPGQGFLAELCKDWEGVAHKLAKHGTRTLFMRLGIVLTPNGGALAKMLTPFRFGLGGRLGNGCQFWSWITLEDVITVIKFALSHDNLNGSVNVVSPEPLNNREFTKLLASQLNRPAFFPVPAYLLRLIFGEMADETLLSSTKVFPEKLLEAGYKFIHPDLKSALKQLLLR